MLRLLVPTVLILFGFLLVAGKDEGQLRPGLARAVAEGRSIRMIDPLPDYAMPAAEAAPLAVKSDPPAALLRKAKPEPAKAQPPQLAAKPAEPVFTLSALPALSGDRAQLTEARLSSSPDANSALPDESLEATQDIRYIKGSLVNVRLSPSTDSAVVGQLTMGEAVSVLASEGSWSAIRLEGDGLEGFVATRLLGFDAP